MAYLLFTLMGLLGGVVNVFVHTEDWRSLKHFKNFRTVFLGAVVGLIYSLMYSDWGFPDGVMSFVSGYSGVDFLTELMKKKK